MSTDLPDSLDSLSPAQRQVLIALKRRGEASADELATTLGITASGVRQHLTALRSAGFVECRPERGRPGRPVDLYYGTDLAEAMVSKTSGALIVELLEVIEDEDPKLLLRLFQQRKERRVKDVQDQLRGRDLPDRVAGLAKVLDDEGYLSSFEELADDTYQITLHNCAIWESPPATPKHAAANSTSSEKSSPTRTSNASTTRSRAPMSAGTRSNSPTRTSTATGDCFSRSNGALTEVDLDPALPFTRDHPWSDQLRTTKAFSLQPWVTSDRQRFTAGYSPPAFGCRDELLGPAESLAPNGHFEHGESP